MPLLICSGTGRIQFIQIKKFVIVDFFALISICSQYRQVLWVESVLGGGHITLPIITYRIVQSSSSFLNYLSASILFNDFHLIFYVDVFVAIIINFLIFSKRFNI